MDRYSRQTLFRPLGPEGQARLEAATAVVVGCGALGTHSAELLARAGIGSLRLVDRDIVEWSNLHRQGGFEESDARERRPKAEALAGWLRRVSSGVNLDVHVEDFNHSNALALSSGATVLLDGTDNLPTRFLLNDTSYHLGIPWIYAGAVGSSAHVEAFSGASGPCLRCQLPELPPAGTIATCDTGGILGPTAALAAAWQTSLALRIVGANPGERARAFGQKVMLDPWKGCARVAASEGDPGCPVCCGRTFAALDGAFAERAVSLCGRGAVQVLPSAGGGGPFDFAAARDRLGVVGRVEDRGVFVRVSTDDGVVMTLFRDGRAIFDGLTDAKRARTLYARFVGQ